MCGLLGHIQTNRDFFDKKKINEYKEFLKDLERRGPNNNGYFVDDEKKIFLGHTRLSILDLSKSANQPMLSSSKKLIMIFNGEVYNHQELYNNIKSFNISKEIEKSDTKVLIEHISIFGFQQTLSKINGMFSIALYDIEKKIFYLARDYWGKKPLYYFVNDRSLFFCSTLGPLIKSRILKNKICKKALNEYFNCGYITGHRHSIISEVKQLKPNTILEFNLNYPNEIKIDSIKNIFDETFEEKKKFDLLTLENYIVNAVDLRLKSDVNTGLLLSSGIDSSLIASISSKINKNIDSFSISFEKINNKLGETERASEISKNLGINNHRLDISTNDLMDFINNVENVYDEPFADSSQIPTMIVFSEISKFAKVALTGDGGDEIFYGYNRYKFYNYWTQGLCYLKPILNLLNTNLVKNFITKNFNDISENKFEKFTQIFLKKTNINYSDFIRLSFNKSIVKDSVEQDKNEYIYINNLKDLRENDIRSYMCYDILTKVDRASMYYSVEARSPLLDINIFRYLKFSKVDQNINYLDTKILLKRILAKYLPKKFINKKKKGFSIPIEFILLNNIKNEYFKIYEYLKNKQLINNLNHNNIEKYSNLFFLKNDFRYTQLVWALFVYFKWYIKYEEYLN